MASHRVRARCERKQLEGGDFNEGYDPPSAGADANKKNKRDDDPYDNFDKQSENSPLLTETR